MQTENTEIKLPPGRYITVVDLAAAVSAHPTTIRRRCEDGTLKVFRLGSKKRSVYRIIRSSAEAWIKERMDAEGAGEEAQQ